MGPNSTKLAKRYYGPFKVLEHIGTFAYKLLLPKGSRIHHVFHCSLLKPFHHDAITELQPLPLSEKDFDNHLAITPLTILGTHWNGPINDSHLHVLVQWVDLPVDDTSWEDLASLKADYHLKDKVILDGVGSDRPSTIHGA